MFFSKKTTNLFLLIVLILAGILRIWKIDLAPPGALVDEASFGYNAYAILKTGKDEWGEKFPLTFKSFGDYKPPGYVYLTVPFVKLFGLNLFSTRILSSISGVMTIFIVYLLITLLTKKNHLAVITSFILAISPWHIYMSRMAWDSNIALMFLLTGLFLLLKAISGKISTLLLSSLLFSLALYSYAGYRLLTPLFILVVLIFLYIKKIISFKKIVFFLFFIFVFSFPLIPEVLFKGALTRFNQVSIISQQDNTMVINEKRAFCGMQGNKLLLKVCYLVWNKPLVISTNFLKKYITAFSYDFLFYPGDQALFLNNPEYGGLYFWLFPFFLLGLVTIFKNYRKISSQIIFLILLVSPIATAIAGSPHYERVNLIFIPIIFICALGVDSTTQKLNKYKKFSLISTSIFLILCLSSVFMVMLDYFFVYTKKSMAWDEYYLDIYKYLKSVDKDYDVIFIKKFNKNPYIYQLFYQSIDPEFFRNNVVRDKFEVLSVGKYKYIEGDFDNTFCLWQKTGRPKTIYVTNEIKETYDPLLIISSFNKVHKRAAIYDFARTENYLKTKEISPIMCK